MYVCIYVSTCVCRYPSRICAALDVYYSAEDVGEELMPSRKYPSDRLSIAAEDLQLLC
jgi:hypothetical protein